ncbi:inositol monophosphatase/fructose-1,6-bisphosphatase family protein [secondary endosymbiont of Heteropsylla cubana]|uniref:Inositol-1-monophosphatase n=1 Tax=secondary endosymbiont of Heteropsylla cubana TaxID=134287 RepID=J3TGX5_9ENTR|nr:inositol-1-monophosphatase [secondary endosymbiont of Heteropsylla cubana]AFP85782.1 inositol monophosphatase/fructose-1,6-bisphosphatase family protein [secondary endosymbiont of Heteropsylla cubana]
MHPMLNIAIRAARKAGKLISQYYETPSIYENKTNFISTFCRELERLIIEVIRRFYPQHSVYAEKSGELIGKNNDVKWIINPLDSSTNFIKRFPHFSVSIGILVKSCMTVAVIYDPMRNELFTASRGQGAQLNGYRLRGGTERGIESTVLGTTFLFNTQENSSNYISIISKLFLKCKAFRCTGSPLLDLAYVAAGRLDGFFDIALKPCSFLSGELIVREAGGWVTDFIGSHNYSVSGNIIAANPKLLKVIVSTIRNELKNF